MIRGVTTRKRPGRALPDQALPAEEITLQRKIEEAQRIEAGAIPVAILWPKGHPRYLVTVRLRERSGEFECASFSVTSLRPGTSVGTAIVRDLPVAALVREAIRCHLADILSTAEDALENPPTELLWVHYGADGPSQSLDAPDEEFQRARSAYWQARRDEAAQRLGKASGEGKGRRYPPGHLEEVARIVREARRRKEPAQAAVAEVFGIKRSAAANQIARAKTRGLLETEED